MAVAPQDRFAAFLLNGKPDEGVYDRAVMYVGADGSGARSGSSAAERTTAT